MAKRKQEIKVVLHTPTEMDAEKQRQVEEFCNRKSFIHTGRRTIMRRFNQSSNRNIEINTESGLSVIQFRIDRGCQVYGYAV